MEHIQTEPRAMVAVQEKDALNTPLTELLPLTKLKQVEDPRWYWMASGLAFLFMMLLLNTIVCNKELRQIKENQSCLEKQLKLERLEREQLSDRLQRQGQVGARALPNLPVQNAGLVIPPAMDPLPNAPIFVFEPVAAPVMVMPNGPAVQVVPQQVVPQITPVFVAPGPVFGNRQINRLSTFGFGGFGRAGARVRLR
jgi:hypothetical protein